MKTTKAGTVFASAIARAAAVAVAETLPPLSLTVFRLRTAATHR